MAIDILSLQPSKISRNLKGKYVLVYGAPKIGKTSFAAKFKKNLLCAFEMGFNAIDGIYAQPINKWSEFEQVLRQLEKPAAKEMFDTITIDTVSIAYSLCEKYICEQNDVQKIGDIPWGQGYGLVKSKFEACLRKITLMGYGLILITHQEVKKEKDGEDEIEKYAPALDKRAYEICNRLVDVIGYIAQEWDEDGTEHRYLYTRQTPRIVAGSRFKYLAPKVEFGYENLVKAINEAIDKQEKLDGATVVDYEPQNVEEEETLDFNAIREEARQLWTTLTTSDDEEKNQEMYNRATKRIESIFGKPTKLSEISENQVELFNKALIELRALAEEMK